jgi:hypothetical protein
MPHVQPLIVAQLIVLLALANGTPRIAKKILGTILARPLDGGMILADGQPLFGHSKTIRGVVLSIVVTTLGAPSIGADWTIGLVVAATALSWDWNSASILNAGIFRYCRGRDHPDTSGPSKRSACTRIWCEVR